MKSKSQLTIGWPLIAVLDWKNNCKDFEAIARRCINLVGADGWKKLDMFVTARVKELQRAIEKHEEVHGNLRIGSDDGFSDVCYHVVGLGEEEFNRCMKDVTLVEKRYHAPYGSPDGYKESFAYVFLEPSKIRTEQDTKETLVNMVKQAEEIVKELNSLAHQLHSAQQKIMELRNAVAVVKEDLEK